MTSLLIKDLSRSLDREELLAVRGGILLMERPPEEGPQPVDICGGIGGPGTPGLPTIPGLPTFPGVPGGWPRNCWEPSGPSGPCGPALDPRLQ